MTTQSLLSNPLRAFVMETSDVLTIVVSSVESRRLKHNL